MVDKHYFLPLIYAFILKSYVYCITLCLNPCYLCCLLLSLMCMLHLLISVLLLYVNSSPIACHHLCYVNDCYVYDLTFVFLVVQLKCRGINLFMFATPWVTSFVLFLILGYSNSSIYSVASLLFQFFVCMYFC